MVEYRSNAMRERPENTAGNLANFTIRESSIFDVVSTGAVHENDAKTWFSTFFEGCDRFVPVFDENDTYASVRERRCERGAVFYSTS